MNAYHLFYQKKIKNTFQKLTMLFSQFYNIGQGLKESPRFPFLLPPHPVLSSCPLQTLLQGPLCCDGFGAK